MGGTEYFEKQSKTESGRKGQRHEPQEAITSAQKDYDARSSASVRAEAKTQLAGTLTPDSPRQRSVSPLLVTEQTASQSANQPVADRSSSSTDLASVTRQYVSRSEKRADIPFTVETTIDEPAKTQASFEPKPSPFLNALEGRVVYQVAAVELDWQTKQLQQDNAELAVKAEKYDRWVQSSIDSYNRRKEADPEDMREKARIRKAKQRAREKLEAQSQEKSQQQSVKRS